MHYQDTKINFISNREIKNKADDFLNVCPRA